jgi:hypothetical protein
MLSKEEVEILLKEAENRIAELEQFRYDSNNLHLTLLSDQFDTIKQFYQERAELLKMILKIPSLPF